MPNNKHTFDWPLVGNHHITEFLSKSIVRNRISGTYIFTGPDNLGKTTTAVNFAMALLCDNNSRGAGVLPCRTCPSCRLLKSVRGGQDADNEEERDSAHGDFFLVKKEKDKKNISIGQVRELIRRMNMSSFLNSYKVGIVKHADSLSEEAANALLKTLEEPKKMVVIILVAADAGSLPGTVVSRAQVLEFRPVRTDIVYDYLIGELKASRSTAKNFSRLGLGRPALSVKFAEDGKFRETYRDRLNVFLNFFRQDINERFSAVETLLGKDAKGQAAATLAGRILEIWQGAARDLLLLFHGREDLVQHEIAVDELRRLKNRVTLPAVLAAVASLRRAGELLQANVNPRAVLENVAMNI